MNSQLPGILKFVVGDASGAGLPLRARSLDTFIGLWRMIQGWAYWLYITDSY